MNVKKKTEDAQEQTQDHAHACGDPGCGHDHSHDHGHDHGHHHHHHEPQMPVYNRLRDVGRNDPCPCGSGQKFKKCCLAAQA